MKNSYSQIKASQQARLREALVTNFIPKGYVHIYGVGYVAQEAAPKILSLLAQFRKELLKAFKDYGLEFITSMFLHEMKSFPHRSPLLYLIGIGIGFDEIVNDSALSEGLQNAESIYYNAAMAD